MSPPTKSKFTNLICRLQITNSYQFQSLKMARQSQRVKKNAEKYTPKHTTNAGKNNDFTRFCLMVIP